MQSSKIGMEPETEMKVKPIEREILNTRRVLRSSSVARVSANSEKHQKKAKGCRKGDKVSGRSSVDEVKEEVKEETHGDDFGSRVKVECTVVISDDESESLELNANEVEVKRKRGRPRKLEINSHQSDDNGSISNSKLETSLDNKEEEKTDVKLELEEYAEAEKILGADMRSHVKVEIKDEETQVKRKRGRPRKLQNSSQSDESHTNINCKLPRTPDSSSQWSVNRVSSKRLRGRPSKTKENVNCRQESPLTTSDQSMSDSIDESKRPKSAKGPDSDGRKMVRKRGRPPTPQKKRKSGETDESYCKAKKRLKLRESKENEAGRKSKSKSKKLLSERILQLLLAAGWTVEHRPRNGRAYQDAVYLNPEGKTHWSVTKAYHVYKKHLESSMNDQTNSTSGSGFGLLSEEDLYLLGRKTQKKRCDKGKLRSKGKDKISGPVRKIKREEKHNRKRCALSARSSLEDVGSKENGYILFEGKRTVLSWMIDSAIVSLNGKVQCMDCKKTELLLEGIVTKEGIRCNCCDEVFSVLDFEVHAGGKPNQPFKSLYLESGNSLLQCLLESLNKQSESQLKGFHFVDFGVGDPNDDTCGICGDGGDLICCDGCPSTFHQSCLDIKKFPSGTWFCCYCSCKFCEKVGAANHDIATLTPLSSCSLCEEKYHQACVNQDSTVPGEMTNDSFCGNYCRELFEELQLRIGVKQPLPEGFSWTFLRRFELPSEVSDCDISEKIAYNAKLAVAFSVMDECFSPLVDHRSGVNLLENIVYNFGSNFHRLNYSNFLTAVLERGDEIIAVASIRMRGNQLAEMPFIGTRYMYRRQGMCRRLMDGIESALGSLKVDRLVIPAVPELINTWTSGFGFTPVHESSKKIIKNLNLLVFPGVDMLEKSLVKEKKITDTNLSSSNGCQPLANEMSLPVDNEEKKPEEPKDITVHTPNCVTTDVESPSYPVDSCLKSTNVEEGDDDTEFNLKSLKEDVEEKEETMKLTDKDIDSHPDVVDDSHADQADAKRQESGDVEDKTPLSDDGSGGKADEGSEESDQEPDCIIIDHSQPLVNKTLALKREVTSTLRVSPRLIQRSWRTSRVN